MDTNYEELLITADKYMRLSSEEKNDIIKQFFTHFMYIEAIIQNQTDGLVVMDNDNTELPSHTNLTKKLYTDNSADEQKLDTIYRLSDLIVTNEDLMNKFISIYSSRFTQTNKTLKLIELNDSFIKYLRDDQIVELPDELSSSNAVAEKINNDKYELLLNVKSTQEFLLYGILFAVKSTVDLLVFPFNEKNMEYEELFLKPEVRTIHIL